MMRFVEEEQNKQANLNNSDKAGKSACNLLSNQFGFAVFVLALAGIWLVALPWIARQPQMAAHLQWLEDQGIDGGAMYYTELEAMQPILERLERRR